MMRSGLPTAGLLCGLALQLPLNAQAAEPAKRLHDKAAARLEQELKQHPDDPALRYNHGTLLYHDGDYEQAADSLRKALSASRSSLQGHAAYNLGNAYYRLGQAKEATGGQEALALYRQALDGYRLAIRQNPQDRDAQYNYELVEKRLKALEAQQAKTQDTKTQQTSAEQQEGETTQDAQQQEAAQQKAQAAQQSQEAQAASEVAGQPEEQAQVRQSQTGQPRPAQAGEQRGVSEPGVSDSAEPAAFDQQELSRQQALWILDSVKREEQGARVRQEPGHGRESTVERNW